MHHRLRHFRIALLLVLPALACRPKATSWPSEPADLVGRVEEVRMVQMLGADEAIRVSAVPSTGSGLGIQRLTVRVGGSRIATPGTPAHIGVDGITELVRGTSTADVGDRPELTGAVVRIWFRGPPVKANPGNLIAMARVVVIDSVATTH
jgi:hypothetical protein